MNMDYEKAYKAALGTATQWIKDGCTDKEKICLECVSPELRDSEDERIRKKLYYTVLGTPDSNEWFEDISKDAILAWLEKYKEAVGMAKQQMKEQRYDSDND